MLDPEKEMTQIKAAEFFLKNLWGKRAKGMDLSLTDIMRPVTHENLEYLCNYYYPYVQIISTGALFLNEVEPKYIRTQSGWVIHDYIDAMSTSRGSLLYDTSGEYFQEITYVHGEGGDEHGNVKINLIEKAKLLQKNSTRQGSGDDGDGGETELKPISGTTVEQMFDTSLEMILLAKERNWAGIHIVSGTKLMEAMVWAHATNYGIKVSGFEPTKEDELRRQRLKTHQSEVAAQIANTYKK